MGVLHTFTTLACSKTCSSSTSLSVGMLLGARNFNVCVNYMSGKGFVPYVLVYSPLQRCVHFEAGPERREDPAVIPSTPLVSIQHMEGICAWRRVLLRAKVNGARLITGLVLCRLLCHLVSQCALAPRTTAASTWCHLPSQ